ncbi:MAG TPA: hypothetical protein PLJ21_01985, partial [Pseudobdellovibrionaceae bacterium]|nr:hypothetical protein [Pseudobdellovibrionaceae bacterium]
MKAYFVFLKENKILLILFFALGIFSFFSSLHDGGSPLNSKGQTNEPEKDTPAADTFIPKGMVLVPIELQNADALNGILNPLGGVVDLYKSMNQKSENQNHKTFPVKISRRVK